MCGLCACVLISTVTDMLDRCVRGVCCFCFLISFFFIDFDALLPHGNWLGHPVGILMDAAMRLSRCRRRCHRNCLALRWQRCPRCWCYWHLRCRSDTHSNYNRPHKCDTHRRSNHRYQSRDGNPSSRNNRNRSLNEDVRDGGRLVRGVKINAFSKCVRLCECVC